MHLIDWIHKFRRQSFIVIIILLTLLLVTTKPSLEASGPVNFTVDAGGFLLLILGISLRLWATAHIGGRKRRELVMTGPFRFSRNPLYLGTIIATAGLAFLLKRWTLAALAWALVVIWYRLMVAKEEQDITKGFGQAYEEYRTVVPRFIGIQSLKNLAPALHDTAPSGTRRFVLREMSSVSLAFAAAAVLLEGWGKMASFFLP